MGFVTVCWVPAAVSGGDVDPAAVGGALLRLAVHDSHADGHLESAQVDADGVVVGRAGSFHSTQAALLVATGDGVETILRGPTSRRHGAWFVPHGRPADPGDVEAVLRRDDAQGWLRPADGVDQQALNAAVARSDRAPGDLDAAAMLRDLDLPSPDFPGPDAGGVHVVALYEDGLRRARPDDAAFAAALGDAAVRLTRTRWESTAHARGAQVANVGRALPGCHAVLAAHHNGVARHGRIVDAYPDWAHDVRAAFLPADIRPSRN